MSCVCGRAAGAACACAAPRRVAHSARLLRAARTGWLLCDRSLARLRVTRAHAGAPHNRARAGTRTRRAVFLMLLAVFLLWVLAALGIYGTLKEHLKILLLVCRLSVGLSARR